MTPRVHRPRVHKEHRPAEMSTDTNEAIEQLRAAIAKGKAFKDDDEDDDDDDDQEEEEEDEEEQKAEKLGEYRATIGRGFEHDCTGVESR